MLRIMLKQSDDQSSTFTGDAAGISRIISSLRGYWSLELNFLDQKLAKQGFQDTSPISHLVELSLRGFYRQNGLFGLLISLGIDIGSE